MAKVCYKPNWYISVELNKVPDEDRTVMATWGCNWGDTSNFEVFWRYGLPNGKFVDSTSSVSYIPDNFWYQNKFTYPENATWVQVWVRPKGPDDGGTWGGYYCPWSPGPDGVWFYVYDFAVPKDVPTPEVTSDKYRVTIVEAIDSIDYDSNTQAIHFYIVDELGLVIYQPTVVINRNVSAARYQFDGQAGKKYKVAARGVNRDYNQFGKWSSYSGFVEMPPDRVEIASIKAISPTSVNISVPANSSNGVKSRQVNYTSSPNDFKGNDEGVGSTKTFDNLTSNTMTIEGLESGKTWYFRIRNANDSGASGWSEIKSVLLGIKPSPPTTWSNTVTAKVGEIVSLNWTHNSRDGSSMQSSNVWIKRSDSSYHDVINVPGVKDQDTQEWLNSGRYLYDTSKLPDGTTLQWKVQTRGVLETYSDYSVTREVKVYAPPTLSVNVYKTQTPTGSPVHNLDSFPFYIVAQAGPESQKAISFHISIAADKAYQKVDYNGEMIWVNENETIYSHFFDFDATQDLIEFEDYAVIQNNTLTLKLMPYDVDFETGQSYTIKATVAMNSGLSSEAYATLKVDWQDQELYPQADVYVDEDEFTATIVPFCPILPDDPTGMSGFNEGGIEDLPLVEDVLLSVYRIDYDGRMTKILDDIPNDRSSAVIDPHPAIDYARYRIVAITESTGAVGYTDVDPVSIGQPGIVIQWDESWQKSIFINPADNQLEGVAGWSGSRLTLPFNVKTSESNEPDRSTVEYIGQEHPTSYFGTQLGTKASWSSVIEKSDSDRLDLIRKLNRYQGNVYVRNSRGVGYWAIVKLSYNIDYGDEGEDLLIPINIDVTRVRGGI